MPPRNNPLPAAVRLFNCAICDKGYPRQLDYENHLRSYDHNHRQRLADMKKLTASNDSESSNKPKQGLDMRSIDVENANKKPGVGSRFTKIGGAGAGVTAARGGFKKVGVPVVGEGKKDGGGKAAEVVQTAVVAPAAVQADVKENAVMADEDAGEAITWEEYDFTKPTGCDHASCSGCKTDGIWSGEWVAVGAA
ncbi:c2h2 type zinc finger containing protein [Stemphylium lycopersici]|uniref:C2h2 type zinc finger containing protein n=1 Tax=Stemphylium lycopersici TaxID=183478 RepID=A0A364NCZ9_STELY|nr:c2h2 type zinc finger containing protein [Stemphylium lycopersici]RAR07887.1 c2h2 type zinc finger containing protein [Stemphylium lycopersici]RAR15120.1 c2h2 type zinc finger containing protein [Stemphylium lycopersici]